MHVWGKGLYGNSLYLPLNFAVYLKLLLKVFLKKVKLSLSTDGIDHLYRKSYRFYPKAIKKLVSLLARLHDPRSVYKNQLYWASLVVHWLTICLPMQGTRVRALVWEESTCHGATGPVSHNY